MSNDEFTFEVRRSVTLGVLLCNNCGAKETNTKNWLLGYKQNSKFRHEWEDNDKVFFCKGCNERASEGVEEKPVMINVDLSYLRAEIDTLIGRALINSSKRSTSLIGVAKQRRIRKDEIIPEYNEKIDVNLRKIKDT
jgi:hypothetical protein